KVGDPFDETTEIGPLATEQILNGVHEQVQKSIAAGAKLLTGGNRIAGPGFFYEPTVLVDVPKDAPAFREEVFGPVAAVFRVRDCDCLLRRFNRVAESAGLRISPRQCSEDSWVTASWSLRNATCELDRPFAITPGRIGRCSQDPREIASSI